MPLYSSHIFLFPFKWSGSGITDLSSLLKVAKLEDPQPPSVWQSYSFAFGLNAAKTYHSYNEYAYFHDYARDILSLDHDGSVTKKQFSYKLPEQATYRIEIKNEVDEKPAPYIFDLEIEDITLNFYETGVGVLAFHLNNTTEADFDKILKINEYGRRIYPQFLGKDFKEVKIAEDKTAQVPNFTSDTKWNFLPEVVQLMGFGRTIQETFDHYNSIEKVQKQPFILPAHIQELLGDTFTTHVFEGKNRVEQMGKIIIEPIIDDRMFTMSFLHDTEKLKILRGYVEAKDRYIWQDSRDWYRYLFTDDSDATIHSRPMMRRLLTESTNDRWLENRDKKRNLTGHLFGVSRYSFVILTADCWFSQNLLIHHFKTLYFQMVQLVLVQRASILNFSTEVSKITEGGHIEMEAVSKLYANYIQFINKIYFREITPQEQGIELYKLLHNRLDIEQNVKDLDAEIKELHDFVDLQENKRLTDEQNRRNELSEIQNNELAKLTKLATVFLPATLVLSFFGLNYFGGDGLYFWQGELSGSNLVSIVVILFFALATTYFSQRIIKWLLKKLKI
jgi:Mg2+ and Co2+ transporter CorA